MSRMVEVVIDSVRVSLTNQQRIVVLRDVHSERYLTIWIGPYEAESITIALQEIELARPQTHDLIKKMLSALNARLEQVEVVSLREDVFYADLVVDVNGSRIRVDSRPSDAIALAVRAHAPILVAEDVMEAAGIMPETDIQNGAGEVEEDLLPEDPDMTTEELPDEPESASDRLSIFEDFLANLDVDSDEPPAEDKNDEEDPDKK
ncbi:MAG TPA: bifunctional nuclease family protein [Anaerolineaceae bacterium]|nr:bifunctional nuclease family protein [Anaerolineaceae bacterium]